MSKDIKDYLHLYLGCEVHWVAVANEVGTLVGISKSEVEPNRTVAIIGDEVFQEWYIEEIKPILRPLSDITEEEVKECNKAMGGKFATKVQNQNVSIVNYEGEKVRYLLSKHFDLFGLIESGLAIDKTNRLTPEQK